MLTREEVVNAYRFLLGREPESEQIILNAMTLADWRALRDGVMQSEEYRLQVGYQRFPSRWVLAPVLGGRREMWLDLSDRFVSLNCLIGDYEPLESAFVRTHLRPDSVFVDVGANVGWYTLLASTIIDPSGRIIAFEPRSDTSLWLARSIAQNDLTGLVALHDCALSNRRGPMFINHADCTDNPGNSYLTAQPAGPGRASHLVRVETLDSFDLSRLDVLKMDVEGAEPLVVEGALETIRRYRPVILSELHPRQLQAVSGVTAQEYLALLKSLGYRATCLGPIQIGEEITDFPADWSGDAVNVGLTPEL